MKLHWRNVAFLLLTLALLFSILPASAAPPAQASGDWPIQGGRFFTQAAGGQGGFSVVDNSEARFWSEFQRLGGLDTVGYPISRRFVYDGFVTQAFQKLVLQWRPEVNQAWPVNVFDELSKKGYNSILYAARQTPYPLQDFDPAGATWAQIVTNRHALLNANTAIRARYFAQRDPLNVYGLPVSRVEDMGNHFAIRTQRAVFQQWKENVPWAAAGQVTIANGGDIAKELGWLSGAALQPEPTGGTPSSAHWTVQTLLVGPGTPGRLYALQYTLAPSPARRLMVSDDQGATWLPFAGGLPAAPDCLFNINMDYATADALYASTCEGLFRWQANQWQKISNQVTQSVAIAYTNPQDIWAISHNGSNFRLLHSTDGAQTWTDTGIGREGASHLAIDPRNANDVYLLWGHRGWWHGILRITPSSRQGTELPMPLEERPVVAGMALDGATGAIYILARAHSGADPFNVHELWRATNPNAPDPAAVRWERAADLGADTNGTLLAAGRSPSGLALYANFGRPGQSLTLHRSLDGGQTWTPITIP